MHLGSTAYLAHVSSHTDVICNEWVDALAKGYTSLYATKSQQPLPKCYIKTTDWELIEEKSGNEFQESFQILQFVSRRYFFIIIFR